MTLPPFNLPALADVRSGQSGLFTMARPIPALLSATRPPRQPRQCLTVLLMDGGRPGDPPMDVRLARALKCLGRRYRLRVKSIETAPSAPDSALSPAATPSKPAQNCICSIPVKINPEPNT